MPGRAFTISGTVLVAHLADEAVLLHLDTKAYFRLNGTGAFIWRQLEAGRGRKEVIAALQNEYAVSATDAARELDRLLDELGARRLVSVRSQKPAA